MPQYPFGEWLPDQSVIASPGLHTCDNAIPTSRGYKPFPGNVEEPGKSAISTAAGAECRGAFSGETENGTEFIIAATNKPNSNDDPELKVIFGSSVDWLDASPTSGLITLESDAKWEFAQYGNYVIAAAKGVDPHVIDLDTTPGPSNRFVPLGSGASEAGCVAVFKNFAILGDLVGQGNNASAIGTKSNAIHWSAIGNVTSWPDVGTDAATNAQSDWQLLDGNGGAVTAIVPGGEYCAVFQERAVWRLDYVGAPNVFSLRLIEASTGCSIPRAAVAVNNVVYFLSNQGFMAFDGASVRSIGSERVDQTFIDSLDRTYTSAVFAAHNAEEHCVFWTLQNGINGAPSIFAYQYEMDRWFRIGVNEFIKCIFSALEPNVTGSLDLLPYSAMQMDNASGDTTLQNANLDALGLSRGRTVLSYFDRSEKLHTFSDFENRLTMTLKTGDFETPENRRAILNYVRPAVDGQLDFVLAGARNSLSPDETGSMSLLLDKKGDGVYIAQPGSRVGGRYLNAQFQGSDIDALIGYDVDLRVGAAKR